MKLIEPCNHERIRIFLVYSTQGFFVLDNGKKPVTHNHLSCYNHLSHGNLLYCGNHLYRGSHLIAPFYNLHNYVEP